MGALLYYDSSNSGNWHRAFGVNGNSGPEFWQDPSGNFGIVDAGNVRWNTGYTVTTNTWTHVVFTRDAAGNFYLYVNGSLFASTAIWVGTPIWSADKPAMGANPAGSFVEPWVGKISSARWYTRALQPVEVARWCNDRTGGLGLIQPRAFWSGGSSATHLTLVQNSWLWTGNAIHTDAKVRLTMIQRTWAWTANAMSTDAKTHLTFVQRSWQWNGFAALVNSKTNLTLTQRTWAWTAQAIGVAQDTMLTLAQKTWAWTGNTLDIITNTTIRLTTGTWVWVGNRFPGFSGGAHGIGTVVGVVRGVVRRVLTWGRDTP